MHALAKPQREDLPVFGIDRLTGLPSEAASERNRDQRQGDNSGWERASP